MSATFPIRADAVATGDQIRLERRRADVVNVFVTTKSVGNGKKVPIIQISYRWVENHPERDPRTTDLRPGDTVRRFDHAITA